MSYIYKKCGPEDIGLLTKTRIIVLRAANKLPETADMTEVEEFINRFKKAMLRWN